MKAVIEENNGLYIIRINGNDGTLQDVYVVDDIEFKEHDGFLAWRGRKNNSTDFISLVMVKKEANYQRKH